MPSFIKHLKGIQKMRVVSKKPFALWGNMFGCPTPTSSVFDSKECIWYHGVVYVKETTAATKVKGLQEEVKGLQEEVKGLQEEVKGLMVMDVPEDNDEESVSSGNSSIKGVGLGKQKQLMHLRNGMKLRHLITSENENVSDEWLAVYDATTNRIIRDDGVAFETLRQFSRVHCNELLPTKSTLINVWSDPNFQYQTLENEWVSLHNLKKGTAV
jgi:hypothetical protein